MIEKIIKKIEKTEITISQWVFGFVSILFIRFIFESISSPTTSGIIPSDAYTLVHYGLFWTTLTLGLIIIIGFFIKDYLLSSKIALFGLPVIWLAPIFDIVISKGHGFTQSYVFDNGSKLIYNFFTFSSSSLTHGATYGIRIEMLMVLIGIGWYLWRVTKNFYKTSAGVVLVYILGFILGSWPGIVYTLSHMQNQTDAPIKVYQYFAEIIFKSTISHNTLHDGMASASVLRFFELGFDKLASQILFIVSFFLSGFLFWKIDRKKFSAIVRNIRLERIGSYLALLICGMGYAYLNNFGGRFVYTDLLGMGCLFISLISIWMYAVHNNDVADIDIDKISNTNRPLVKKEVGEKEMKETGYIWLIMALLSSWSAGFYPFFMNLVYISASHIYSSPPLRLRRFPVVSSFLIGVASLAVILTGFFFVSIDKQIQTFPILLAVGIIIMVTLAINVKDMKDIEGDKANGILTLPILFGKNGGRVVGICFAMSFLLVPIFLSFYFLYIFAIPASIIGYKLVIKKPYREEPIFILRFVFLLGVGAMYVGIIWLSHVI